MRLQRRPENQIMQKPPKAIGISMKNLMILVIILTSALCAVSFPISNAVQYDRAEKLLESGDYNGAYKAYGLLLDRSSNYKDASAKQNECIYQQAKALTAQKKYIGAYEKYASIAKYKDSGDQMKAIYNQYKAQQFARLKAAKKGDTVTLGTYDGEPIEWIVLSKNKDKNKTLLVSKYILTEKPFDKKHDVTWDKSAIRKWLGGNFYKKSFDDTEKKRILVTKVKNKKNTEYDQSSGKNTSDRIFLLSIDEAKKYFPSDEARICKNKDGSAKAWCLRTQGNTNFRISLVASEGSINTFGNDEEDDYGIRPAMWVNTK